MCYFVFTAIFIFQEIHSQTKDFSNVPGVVVAYSPSAEKVFLGTPSIVILPNGTYVTSHDFFGSEKEQVSVYESKNKGKSWSKISEFDGFWMGLFCHKEALYILQEQCSSALFQRVYSWPQKSDGSD